MIRYIPCSTGEVAVALTRALLNLSMPAGDRPGFYATQQMFPVETMPDGQSWVAFHTDTTVKVHADADLSSIKVILQPYVDRGMLPENILTELQQVIDKCKSGPRLVIWQWLPDFFKQHARSQEQMMPDTYGPLPINHLLSESGAHLTTESGQRLALS